MQINKIYNEDCLLTMGKMEDSFIDLTITYPPYDDMRDYHGYSFDLEKVALELFSVTKKGGIVVWVVSDKTINGSETGTRFKQVLTFIESGFRLMDTMIFKKHPKGASENNKLYCKDLSICLCSQKELLKSIT